MRFDRADLHDDVPAETAITHIDDLKCAAPNEPKRPKISKTNSPAVRYQFANKPISKSLHEGHGVSKALYDEAVKVLTVRGLVEIIGLCGYYTLVSMTLNTFEFGLPDGQVSELA